MTTADEALESFGAGAERVLDRPLNDSERSRFAIYLKTLIKWHGSHRLLGSSDPGWIVQNVFLDSLLFGLIVPAAASSMLDLGSGAGVPGIPLALVRPGLETVLLESRRRRASFLSSAIRELGLERARVIHGRLEDHLDELGGRFDAVVIRCAGSLRDILPVAAKLISASGMVVASGPPSPHPLTIGEWVRVTDPVRGRSRLFAVFVNR